MTWQVEEHRRGRWLALPGSAGDEPTARGYAAALRSIEPRPMLRLLNGARVVRVWPKVPNRSASSRSWYGSEGTVGVRAD